MAAFFSKVAAQRIATGIPRSMGSTSDLLSDFNRFFKKFSGLPAEVQVIVGFIFSLFIALMMKLMLADGGLPSIFEYWVALAVFCCGLLIGPSLGFLVAIVCGIMFSPLGVFAATAGEPEAWLTRIIVLVIFGLLGGALQRLIHWLGESVGQAKNRMERTGLPNISAALSFLRKAIENDKNKSNHDLDILNIKLNNLDAIRQRVGQDKTDELLVMLAEKLKVTLGKNSHVSQLVGNELVGIQAEQTKPSKDVQQAIMDMLDEPLRIGEENFQLNASTGMHRTQPNQFKSSPQQLLDDVTASAIAASAANKKMLYKDAEKISVEVGELTSSRQVQLALSNNEFSLCYQPRLNTNTGFFASLEAMVCWNHPKRGKLWFDDFSPMLEEESMLQYFTLWTVRETFADVETWLAKGYKFRLSLNITLNDVLNSTILAYIIAEIKRRPMLANVFSIEISERALVRSEAKARQYLKHIQHAGVLVIVTNFGGDGATIQALFRMPVDAVKLSDVLVKKAMHHSDQKRELATLIKMIRSRGLTTIADGVSDKVSLVMLRQLGCEELQGPILSDALIKNKIPWERVR